MAEPRKHRVLMITTGGTIGGNVALSEDEQENDEARKARQKKADAEQLEKILGPTQAALEGLHNMVIEVDSHELVSSATGEVVNIDSSDVTPELWVDLASTIQANFEKYDSFIVTHGTNTLGYTCAALSFAIANSAKPIVLTGSQVPMGQPGTDAVTNLENALRVAVWQGGHEELPIRGVVAVFGSFIITGTRVKKDTEFDYDAFKSYGAGAIGRIGRIININKANLEKHNSYLSGARYQLARSSKTLQVDSGFNMNIASFTEFPGMDPDLILHLVETRGIEGVILRAFGAGDPATNFQNMFKELKSRKVPIVVTTQAPNGNSNFQVNEPGQWLRANDMAIPAYDMSIESQTTKLAWLIHHREGQQPNYRQVCDGMVTDMRGEIHVMWEI